MITYCLVDSVHDKLGRYNLDHLDNGNTVSRRYNFDRLGSLNDEHNDQYTLYNSDRVEFDHLDNGFVHNLLHSKYGILDIFGQSHRYYRHQYRSNTMVDNTNECHPIDSLLRRCIWARIPRFASDILNDQCLNKSEKIDMEMHSYKTQISRGYSQNTQLTEC